MFSVTPITKPERPAASATSERVIRRISSGALRCTEDGKFSDSRFPGHAAKASATERLPSGGGVKASITGTFVAPMLSVIWRRKPSM